MTSTRVNEEMSMIKGGTGRGRYAVALAPVLALALAASCAGAGAQVSKDRISDPGQMLFNGRTSAMLDCYTCHNGDGRGAKGGPDLANRLPKLDDLAIATAIKEGSSMKPEVTQSGDGTVSVVLVTDESLKRDRMPSYGTRVDVQQIAQITAWLRSGVATRAKR